ncbi:hypothetical protein DFP93_104169 [Aneurinibacillus soli]|uniref:Uncharacterized protein n=1 Tax=Aneurinibacillus soli TaxID=1500254 RepID=A0A0U4WE82_9BACL|nr:hypothetical protein [Aneurinibacillus soli]PYE62519.1 hypothetical protein DFP93_104169 [Aneurinibacillus soli]BAU27081.1 hypothetical protein CB4_01250 [Aneurinibacillus soli]
MYKKVVSVLIAGLMLLSPVSVFAKGFSGGHSSSYHQGGASSVHNSNRLTQSPASTTYHSGYRSPSSQVSNHTQHSYTNSSHQADPPKKSGGFLSHAAAFGAGTLLGSMIHPFGGASSIGAGGTSGFSSTGLLVDIVIIAIGFFLIRRLVSR